MIQKDLKLKYAVVVQDTSWLLFSTGNTPCSLVWQRFAPAVSQLHIVGSYSFRSTGVQSSPAWNRRKEDMNKSVRSHTIKGQLYQSSSLICVTKTGYMQECLQEKTFFKTLSIYFRHLSSNQLQCLYIRVVGKTFFFKTAESAGRGGIILRTFSTFKS